MKRYSRRRTLIVQWPGVGQRGRSLEEKLGDVARLGGVEFGVGDTQDFHMSGGHRYLLFKVSFCIFVPVNG